MLLSLSLEPVLVHNEYIEVLTLDRMPDPPISDIVRTIRTQNLSIFENSATTNPCKFVLIHPIFKDYLLEDDIPFAFSYFIDRGFVIDTQLTKLYKPHLKTLICLLSDKSIL